MEKMTRKEMFTFIMEHLDQYTEVVEFCQHNIEMLEKSKSKPKVEKPEDVELRASVATFLSEAEAPVTNKALAEEFGISTQKMAAVLRKLEADDTIIKICPEKKKDAATFVIA